MILDEVVKFVLCAFGFFEKFIHFVEVLWVFADAYWVVRIYHEGG